MSTWQTGVIAAALAATGSILATASEPRGAPSLLLFGAAWCAPCIAELRAMPALAAATRPGRVILIWDDGSVRRVPLDRLENVEIAQPGSVLYRRRSAVIGLPYAQMIDDAGRPCADWKGPVTPDRIAAMRAACARAQPER